MDRLTPLRGGIREKFVGKSHDIIIHLVDEVACSIDGDRLFFGEGRGGLTGKPTDSLNLNQTLIKIVNIGIGTPSTNAYWARLKGGPAMIGRI